MRERGVSRYRGRSSKVHMKQLNTSRNSLSLLRAIIIGAAALFVCSLNTLAARGTEMLVGKTLTKNELRAMVPAIVHVGDDNYEVVNSQYLSNLQKEFQADLNRKGIRAYEGRFDCNKFTSSFVSTAQVAFVVKNWHRKTANALALGEIWFRVDQQNSHAVIVAVTERGLVFWDPQKACEVKLTPEQIRGAMLVKI